MRIFRMKFLEAENVEPEPYICTVICELTSPDGRIGLHVSISPPVPRELDGVRFGELNKDLDALFGIEGGIDRAILFARWVNNTLSPHISSNPTLAHFMVPKGRTDWEFGEFHIIDWASVMDDGPIDNAEWAEKFE